MTATTDVRATPTDPTRGRLRPLGLGDVRIVGGFWADRQRVNASASLAHIERWMHREGWIANFDLAAAGGPWESRRGREFSDSEVYKLLEAMAWEIGREGDPDLDTRFRALVTRVTAAQEADGYLNTQFGRPGQAARWSDLEWGHELYCLGHLFQAAVARARTRPRSDDGLLEVARRAADLVCTVFSDDGIASVCGHPEIEPALVELARVTGESRYLTQAALFVDRRGRGTLKDIEWGRAYYQDDVPVREATVLRGHAVRAGYLSAGAVDVAVELEDDVLLQALAGQWANTVARRTYLTGGQGSHHQTEAFGEDWVLPPDRAYSETCASVASVMFSWRLLLAIGGAQYADLIERTLYNVVATSPSREGTAFYYANTLHQRRPGEVPVEDEVCPRATSSMRAPWFAVSCCPPNVARTLASLAAYIATVDDTGLQLHQYASARIRTALPDGRPIALDVETEYPRDGVVRVIVREPADGPWTLTLRVPSWAEDAVLVERLVGSSSTTRTVSPGAVELARSFQPGDVVELHLPVQPRFTRADSRVDAVRGCTAVERGPVVMCLESTDLDASARHSTPADLSLIAVDGNVAPREQDGRVFVRTRVESERPPSSWPYGEASDVPAPDTRWMDVPLVAYHDWANRGPSTMRVWLPLAGVEPLEP
ncbi:MAG: glycoside hydrolase family 127 protein [Actinomycetales bacterium]